MEPQQVVLGETATADGYLALQATMRSVPVVAVTPDRSAIGAVFGSGICLSICPLAQRGLDEALGFAVSVGSGADVFEAEALASFPEGLGELAGSVLGHDPLDGRAEALVVGDRCFQEVNGTLLALGGHDLGEGDAGMIVADQPLFLGHLQSRRRQGRRYDGIARGSGSHRVNGVGSASRNDSGCPGKVINPWRGYHPLSFPGIRSACRC